VGEDQLPHIELTREIVRRFNHLYGPTLVEPKGITTKAARLPGTDGRKMSKSYGNAIALSDPPEEYRPKVMQMLTDPARKRRNDPGNPEICPVFDFHNVFSKPDEIEQVDRECRVAGIGCVDCKKILLANLEPRLTPHGERRAQLAKDPDSVRDILRQGAQRAHELAQETMQRVRSALHLI